MSRETKADLQKQIDQLKKQLAAVTNVLAPFTERHGRYEYVPCGKMQYVSQSVFEETIRNAVCDQFDGETGWLRIDMSRHEGSFPYENILVQVDYDKHNGTSCGMFCPVAKFLKEQ